ncbi:rifampicin phosphotransferase isoform X4 [Parasteatoda tepidariorum]|uniref:rifampicin phosphotransferase isoform X4 n=1 Tax=Parasteatoda tepidariorum TaxID=114398 RepID=UPI0039BCE34C
MGAVVAIPLTITLSLFSLKPSDVVFWIKFIVSYLCIRITRWVVKGRFDLYDLRAEHDPVKINFISHPQEVILESPLEESQLSTAADEVFFYGANSKSEHLVATIGRGLNHKADAWIQLKLKNGKTYEFHSTAGTQQCYDRKVFSCDGFQMHYLTPMRIWRIFYNGWIKEKNEEDSTVKMVHVKFALLWRTSSVVFDFLSDAEAGALANSLANTKWNYFLPPLEKLCNALNFYAQCGIITGTINVEGEEEEQNIYLFGEKIRYMDGYSIMKETSFMHAFGQIFKDGSFVHLTQVSIDGIVENLQFGFVAEPLGTITAITDKTLNFKTLVGNEEEENEEMNFNCKDLEYIVKGRLSGKEMTFEKKINLVGNLQLQNFSFSLNSMDGAGFVMKGKKLRPSEARVSNLKVEKTRTVPLVTYFFEEICQEPSVTGGKGSSLGKLTELSKKMKNFIVPEGVVVTTAAYELFITKEVLQDIENLERVLYGNVPGDVKEICKRVMEKVSKSSIPDKVLQSIVNTLQKIFPDQDVLKFAVRSSATGEDSEGMSAAGQMDTFLGVSGLSKILTAVKKCWASQFSFTAVQYKRQNGQIINSPMAVVIQKMVPCDVAGVLFTCNPMTGNPTVITITANYGLGESVVSASEEPDTIEIKRNPNDQLFIMNKVIGAKNRRTVAAQDMDGTRSEDVPAEKRQDCCLPDEKALMLADLAVTVEKYYRLHQDIEWGFWKNGLYIFQSRPVTTGCGETDFEIDHELDAPMRTENEFFSVTNVAEVMPGAMSTLSLDVIPKYLQLMNLRDPKAQWITMVPTTYFPQNMVSMHSRIMFYLCNFFQPNTEDSDFVKVSNVTFFGRVVECEGLYETVRYRFKNVKRDFVSKYKPLLGFTKMLSGSKMLKKASLKYDNFRLPLEECNTSQEMLEVLLHSCTDLTEAMACHAINTGISMIWNMFMLYFLKKRRGELNADVYRDFAKLVQAKSDVISADIPAASERLAYYIGKEKTQDEFKKMNVKEIREWLENSQTMAGNKYREFLAKHEHRCLKEFDLRAKPWGMDPDPLIKLLKNLVGNVSYNPEIRKEDTENILSNLGLNLSLKSKFYLKILIHFSQKGVRGREAAKSILIKSLNAWRKGYYHLAKLMVSEGRIPDEDLLFFMTLDEIKELLETRSPKLLSKATHRRRRYPVLDKNIFPEIMSGFPQPIDLKSNEDYSNDENFSMKGNPVSPGVAKAFVRVALTLEEAELLKAGEILVTYSTDIGWSPYFPILAGVVTEIGGLISHGAVVSREYGLPCIAGLRGATRQFKTGDYVLLDGNRGILQRLPRPEKLEDST